MMNNVCKTRAIHTPIDSNTTNPDKKCSITQIENSKKKHFNMKP